MSRKAISKRTRFRVFKRDGFACVYCGGTPPSVVLELDHIDPVANGGADSSDNLTTACFDCNRGKGAESLSAIPEPLDKRAERIKEGEAQLVAYQKILKAKRRRENGEIAEVEGIFRIKFGNEFTPTFRESIRRNFLTKLPYDDVEQAMYMTCERIALPGPAIKYFCGICWRKIKEGRA